MLDYGEMARTPLWILYMIYVLNYLSKIRRTLNFKAPRFQITVCRPVSTLYQFLQVFISSLQFFNYTEINKFGGACLLEDLNSFT